MTRPGVGTASTADASIATRADGTGRARPRAGRPRLAFVGTGWIGRERMRVAVESDAAEVAVVVDPSDEAVDAARRIAPRSRRAAGLAEALESDPDGVVIASPSALHAEQALEALDAGVAVFCQKPIGRTAAETRRVVQAAERRGLLLGADFAYRETRFARRMRETIGSGILGDVYAADLAFHNAYGPDGDWFYDPRLSGGGCLVDLGIHLVDLSLWLLDFPEVERSGARLLAGGRPLAGPVASEASGANGDVGQEGPRTYAPRDMRLGGVVEDYATAELLLADGASIRLACSWNLHAGRDAVIGVDVHGTEAGLSMRNVGGSFYDFRLDLLRGTRSERVCSPPDPWPGRTLLRWARELCGGHGFDASAWRFVDVAALIDDLYSEGLR